MRADKYLAERFGSRTKAKEMLAAGRILRDGRPLSPHDEVSEGDLFTILEGVDFVSNGGKKLERALEVFSVSVADRVVADLGASTGGFTDCLLRRGAAHVFCVDVGKSQLDPRLASDSRVTVMDSTNARYLTRADFPVPIDDVVSDLSFISLRLVLPAVKDILSAGGRAFVLFKPQFECGGKGLGKSGILPRSYHRALLSDFYDFCTALGLFPQGIAAAPVVPRKNIEYVVFLEPEKPPVPKDAFLNSSEKIS